MLLVVWIGDRFEELVVTPGTADILGRTTRGRFDPARIRNAFRGFGNALDADRMFPAVAEIVEVFERANADVF